MTQPLNGGPPAKELMAHVNFNVEPGPDGKPWTRMTIQTVLATGSFLINQDTIDQWTAEMPGTLRELSALMKQVASGLHVANMNDIRNLKKPGQN